MISPLRRSDASARAAVARSCAFSFVDRLLQRRRQQRRLRAAAAHVRRVSRAAATKRSSANVSTAAEAADDRGQPEQRRSRQV